MTLQEALRTIEFEQAGTTNSFGDEQLQADLHSDAVIFRHLRNCPAVSSASSEEQADIIPLGNGQYTVSTKGITGKSYLITLPTLVVSRVTYHWFKSN